MNTLSENPHAGANIAEKDGTQIVECDQCGFRHLIPIPSEEELSHFYERQYFDAHKPTYMKTDVAEDAYQSIAYADRLRGFTRLTAGRKILDVGCGSGQFLAFAARAGWDCYGVEPSHVAAARCVELGLNVKQGSFEACSTKLDSDFDVVHLKNVLEHVRDPVATLRSARCHLKPGGVLYVEVPNDFSFEQEMGVRLLRESRSWISIPDHINYFNFKSLVRLVRNLGFEVRRRDTTFPMYVFLWVGLNFIRDRSAGAKAHRLRVAFELFLEKIGLSKLRRGTYRALALAGAGRTIILYCQKPRS